MLYAKSDKFLPIMYNSGVEKLVAIITLGFLNTAPHTSGKWNNTVK